MIYKIVILDTESSNVSSLIWSINRLGYKPIVSNDLNVIKKSDRLFLPGVGTAQSVMNIIKKKNLLNEILNYKNPILGICLGMQIFCKYSEESSNNNITKTLNIFKDHASLIKSNRLPVPHIGWNNVVHNNKSVLFKNILQGSRFYFVHSYYVPINKYTVSYTFYEKYFSSAIQIKNFFGVQFHPEKSGNVGSLLLKNFLAV
ncbi:imidazole glycerol phosphate synthase subunit HisH [Buchnera aphidicola (Ceratoglyphina bambusae)]|uniref:imidazole glycerol phosphate synthase subunit HisH n=1 Tax=Buchnera aphidicola TaxID=9 RepID=UPI0031B82461